MISGNKVYHFGIYHCANCAGGMAFDYAQLLPYGSIHDIVCPYCDAINTIDIFGGGIYHHIYNPLEGAFK